VHKSKAKIHETHCKNWLEIYFDPKFKTRLLEKGKKDILQIVLAKNTSYGTSNRMGKT
jgi:hypothetical protein